MYPVHISLCYKKCLAVFRKTKLCSIEPCFERSIIKRCRSDHQRRQAPNVVPSGVIPTSACRTNTRNVDAILHIVDEQLALHIIAIIHVQHQRDITGLDRHVLAIAICGLIRRMKVSSGPGKILLKPKFFKIRLIVCPIRNRREPRGRKFLQFGEVE